MKEKIENMPNWLRYILAVPFGLLAVVFISIILIISNYLYSNENWQNIVMFLYKNGINVIVFFVAFNIMMPKYRFQITLTICILLGILYSIVQGMSIMQGTMTTEYIVAYIEFIISLIISCISSFKTKNE